MYAKKNKTKWLPMPSAIWKLNPTEIIFFEADMKWSIHNWTPQKQKKKKKNLFKAKERNIISEQTWRFIVKNF